MSEILSSQFKRKGDNKRKKGPEKPKFSTTAPTSKTMKVSAGKLPPGPTIHPHRDHAGVRSHRAK